MVRSISAKTLLAEYNKEQYKQFLVNDAPHLSLVEISPVPGIGASKRRTIFQKIISHPKADHNVKFISQNGTLQALLWQTTAETLKQGVRWGVITTHALTSKVIAKLGEYRLVSVERISKGMISNSYQIKAQLLDLYQDRFEALQELEILINRVETREEIVKTLTGYLQKLEAIQHRVSNYFIGIEVNNQIIKNIKTDLEHDKQRTRDYLKSFERLEKIKEATRSQGAHAILQFIKNQMLYGLYELQGINQDITFDSKRPFALTRGKLNDFIEDARQEIEEYQPSLTNAINPTHQGCFSQNPEELMTYDFTEDNLSPERERQVLQAISFIEGWDNLEFSHNIPQVQNDKGSETLDVVRATRWKLHRNISAFFRNTQLYFLNILRGFFYETYPQEVETWRNEDFHLVSNELRKYTRPNEPLWQKPLKFFIQIKNIIIDLLYGVEDFRDDLVIRMPQEIINDWEASFPLPSLECVKENLAEEIDLIKTREEERLAKLLKECSYTPDKSPKLAKSRLAVVAYPVHLEIDNDPTLSLAKGLNRLANIFIHDPIAKDPFGGLMLTFGYGLGVAAIYKPVETARLVGANYVNWFNNFSYAMASSRQGAAIAGGSSQAQFFASTWDSFLHGPSSRTLNALYRVGEDPLTVGAYISAAYTLGYVLTNGIAGHPIPWLSEHLKKDLGSVPQAAYPFIGGKFAILLYEGFNAEVKEVNHSTLVIDPDLLKTNAIIFDKFSLANWLCKHAEHLPKVEPVKLFALSKHIDKLFNEKESKSLKKLLYPPQQHSIAFKIFSHPLSYIPAFLRVGIAMILSYIAYRQERESPLAPFKRSFNHLSDKLKKDMVKGLLLGGEILHLGYTVFAAAFKMLASMTILVLGRISGFTNFQFGHKSHQFFATIHVFFRSTAGFLFPARAIKSVTIPHPNHTIMEIESTYAKIVNEVSRKGAKQDAMKEGSSTRATTPTPKTESTIKPIPVTCDLDENSSARHSLSVF